MARIRTVKPEFQNSQSMGRISREARLTFILMWPQCDDSGRIRGTSRMLASVLFPYDDDAPNLIDGWLEELEKEECIVRYNVEGYEHFQIINWNHQKIDHPSPSRLPAPPVKKKKKTKRSSREKDTKEREPSTKPRPVSSTVSSTVSVPKETATPDWLPKQPWLAFLEVRKKLKAPVTEHGIALLLKKLDRLRAAGHDPQAVLEQSVERAWRGLFPVSERSTGPPKDESYEGFKARLKEQGKWTEEDENDEQASGIRGISSTDETNLLAAAPSERD